MSDSLLLDDRERLRFAEYCERESSTLRQMEKQLGVLMETPGVREHFRMRANAFALVARELRNSESFSVRSNEDDK
jgi:predicted Ser/Thr protein kinase